MKMNKRYTRIISTLFLGSLSNHESTSEPFAQLTHFIDQANNNEVAKKGERRNGEK